MKDGRIHFFDDIYGHDRLLDAALRQATRAPTTLKTDTRIMADTLDGARRRFLRQSARAAALGALLPAGAPRPGL